MLEMPKHYPEPLADLADCIYRRLALSAPNALIASIVFDVVEDIRREFGGMLLYIPKGEKFDRLQRNAAILKAFNGTNHRKLAKLYGISLKRVYEILQPSRKQEAGRSRKKQEVSK